MTATLRFALVPIEANSEMAIRGRNALSENGADNMEVGDAMECYRAMIAASPGNDLLERIVSELNNFHSMACNYGHKPAADRIHALLNEIGGGHG